jgi:hypothetical protein
MNGFTFLSPFCVRHSDFIGRDGVWAIVMLLNLYIAAIYWVTHGEKEKDAS